MSRLSVAVLLLTTLACSGAKKSEVAKAGSVTDVGSRPDAEADANAPLEAGPGVFSEGGLTSAVEAGAEVFGEAGAKPLAEAGLQLSTEASSTSHDTESEVDASAAFLAAPYPPLVVAPCGEQMLAFAYTSVSDCASRGFRCSVGQQAFRNECGCGCSEPIFRESGGVNAGGAASGTRIAACGGVVGELALFGEPVRELTSTSEGVWVRTQSNWWSIDTRTALLTAHSLDAPPQRNVVGLGSAPTETQTQRLVAETDIGEWRGVVVDNEFYAASDTGQLWVLDLSDDSAPRVIDRHGAYDDDDYEPLILVDSEAVYWQAGVDFVQRTTDGDPIALYRSCRI